MDGDLQTGHDLEGLSHPDLRHSFASVPRCVGQVWGCPSLGKLLGMQMQRQLKDMPHIADEPARRARGQLIADQISTAIGGK